METGQGTEGGSAKCKLIFFNIVDVSHVRIFVWFNKSNTSEIYCVLRFSNIGRWEGIYLLKYWG